MRPLGGELELVALALSAPAVARWNRSSRSVCRWARSSGPERRRTARSLSIVSGVHGGRIYLRRMTRSCFFASSRRDFASLSARSRGANAHTSVSYNSDTRRPMLRKTAATAKPTSRESTRNTPAPTTIQAHMDIVVYLTAEPPKSLLPIPRTRELPSSRTATLIRVPRPRFTAQRGPERPRVPVRARSRGAGSVA